MGVNGQLSFTRAREDLVVRRVVRHPRNRRLRLRIGTMRDQTVVRFNRPTPMMRIGLVIRQTPSAVGCRFGLAIMGGRTDSQWTSSAWDRAA